MGGRGVRTGRGPSPMSCAGKRGPGSSGNSSVKQRASAETASSVWRPRWSKPPVNSSYSSGTWPAPTPTITRPPESRSSVESSLAARSGWRWARISTCESRWVRVVSAASQPSVAVVSYQMVPMASARPARDGGVVAHAEVEEPGVVGGAGDASQLVRAGLLLPVGHVQRRLRLNRQLHAVDDPALGHGAHHVGGNEGRVGHGRSSVRRETPMFAQAETARAAASSAGVPKVVESNRERFRCRWSGTSQVKPMPPCT